MDSSDICSTHSTETASSDTADNSSTPSKRDIFLSTYRRQRCTLPDSMMHYTAKNSKFYQKIIKSCKYFFIKNPILVVPSLYYDRNRWEILVKETWKSIDINRILAKLWITDKLYVSPENVNNNSLASSIIPKIYRCDACELSLEYQILSINELMFLCTSVKKLSLIRITVKNDDGIVVSFEKFIKQLPDAKDIYYTFTTPSNNTSKTTFDELWKISHFSNYNDFCLINIPENYFDIDSFYSFMKKNKKTSVRLIFSHQISEESKTRLEAIIDETIGTQNREYKPPYIYFPGINREKFSKCVSLFLQLSFNFF